MGLYPITQQQNPYGRLLFLKQIKSRVPPQNMSVEFPLIPVIPKMLVVLLVTLKTVFQATAGLTSTLVMKMNAA